MKTYLTLLLIFVSVMAFAGGTTESAESGETEKSIIEAWFGATTDDQQLILEEHFFGPFEKKHNIEFKVTYDANFDQNLRTATLAGVGPDIYSTAGPGYVLEYALDGYLLSLDDYAVKFGWKDIILPAFWDLSVVDSHLYSIPKTYETLEILYNKKMFEENGWKTPDKIKTIDEFFALSEQIKNDGFEPVVGGNSDWRGVNEWYVTLWFDNVAGVDNVHKALSGEIPWTSEPFVEAVTSLKNYFQNYYTKNYFAFGFNDARYALLEGRNPMYLSGTWGFGVLQQLSEEMGTDDWDWAPFPNKYADRYPIFSLGIGETLSIKKDSEVADMCAEFLNYILTDKDLNRNMAEQWPGEWNFPVNIMTREDYGDNIDSRFTEHLAVVTEALNTGKFGYTTWTFYPQATMSYIIEGIEQVWTDQITVEAFLTKVDSLFQEEYKEGKVPYAPKPQL